MGPPLAARMPADAAGTTRPMIVTHLRHRVASGLAALAAIAAFAAATAPAWGAAQRVRVSDDRFGPRTIRVHKGAKVKWRWAGSDAHNVVGKGFRSRVKTQGTFAHRFTRRGTYRYVCTLHADDGMVGRIVVR